MYERFQGFIKVFNFQILLAVVSMVLMASMQNLVCTVTYPLRVKSVHLWCNT